MPRRLPRIASRWPRSLALSALALTACAGSVVAPMAVNVARNLLGVAQENHGSEYQDVLVRVMETLAGRVADTSSVTAVGMTAGVRGAPPTPEPEPEEQPAPLAVEFDLYQQVVVNGERQLLPLSNGSVLKDGRGDPSAGDRFKIVVQPITDCYLYVVNVDSTGWVQPLFPIGMVAGENPAPAGRDLEVPAGPDWFFLDENRGLEHVYVLASREPNEALEQALRELAAMERPATTGDARVETEEEFMRGIGGIVSDARRQLTDTSGQTTEVSASVFEAQKDAAELVVTRWFRHQ